MKIKFEGIDDPEEIGFLLKKFLNKHNLKSIKKVVMYIDFIDIEGKTIKDFEINGKVPTVYSYYRDNKGTTFESAANFNF